MAGFIFGGGVCKVCRKHGCIPSFHSFEEQEAAEKKCAERKCERQAEYVDGCGDYCRYHYDQISNTSGT